MDTTPRYGNDRNTRNLGIWLKNAENQSGLRIMHITKKRCCASRLEKGVPLSVEQGDSLDETDEELDEQELDAYYLFMAKIQEVSTAESGPTFDAKPLEKVDSNTTPDSSDVCNNDFEDDQNADNQEDERVVLANLIANLKLDTDENEKIQKQLKRANASLTHELNKCKYALAKSNDIHDRCRSALHYQEIELEKYKKYKDFQIEKEELELKLKASLG
ncbi:hypothetical protein Tco_0820504 [Tanacetum coccineum]|uniref:Uncharacterized protein n=1 Tax=Tanacetum coccineum TaxID=301880 RepID=A0ABQ5A9M3_9ASTR